MAAPRAHATVAISSRPLWRIRLGRELLRHLLHAVAVAGLLASARFALDPPRPPLPEALLRRSAPADLAAEGFATLFAQRYLTWEEQDPEARESALAPFIGPGMDPDAGLQPPATGEQRVQWTEVVQEREPQPDEHVYTVAAQTDTAGLLYLSVSVIRGASGLALADYPALVGAPASAPAQLKAAGPGLSEVGNPALSTVVERVLRNYLAGSASELAADLSSTARVSLPGLDLTLQALQSLQWAPGAGAVLAVVQAQDQRGAQYTLAYELDVAREQGRWEVSAIQMNPDD
jgi:conjugative transposon protein TcpC